MANILFSNSFSEDYSIMPGGIVQADDGDYIVVGRAYVTNESSSAFITKIDQLGNIIFEETLSQPFSQFFSAVTKLKDGTFVAVGSYFYSIFSGDEYTWVVRFDIDGNILFQTAIGDVGVQSDGVDVVAAEDGGYVVLSNLVEGGHGIADAVKYDSDNKRLGHTSIEEGRGLAITETKDGGFAIVGACDIGGSLNSNIYLSRLDSDGYIIFSKVYKEIEIYVPLHGDIIQNRKGQFVIAVKSLIMKTDCYGSILWSKQNDSFNFFSIDQMIDGNYVTAGSMIVKDYDHAYIASVTDKGEFTEWNNTELLKPSGFTCVILDFYNFPVACAYIPIKNSEVQCVVTGFK